MQLNNFINASVKKEDERIEMMTEKRDAYIKKLKAKMDEWNADIDRLEAKVSQASAESKLKLQQEIEQIKVKRSELDKRIYDLGKAGGGAWQDLKSGVEMAGDALGQAVQSAISRFK